MSGPDERPRPDDEDGTAPAAPPAGQDATTFGVGRPEHVPPDLQPAGDDAPRADSWGAGAPAPSSDDATDGELARDVGERPAGAPAEPADGSTQGDAPGGDLPQHLTHDAAGPLPADLPDDLPADLGPQVAPAPVPPAADRDAGGDVEREGDAVDAVEADRVDGEAHAPDTDDATDARAGDGHGDAATGDAVDEGEDLHDDAHEDVDEDDDEDGDDDGDDEDGDARADADVDDGVPGHADDEAGSRDGGEPVAAAPGALARGGRRWPLAVLAAVTALAVGGATALGLAALDARDDADDRDQALRVAREASRVLFSYDHRRLQADFAKALALTAGDFREDYERTTTRVVADVAARYKAVVTAEHVASGVVPCVDGRVAVPDGKAVPCRDGEVHVVVFLNQVTTSTRVTGQKVDPSRVRMTLREVGGAWKVVGVTAL